MLDHARVEDLGYFDEAFCPLEMDDDDLCLRAFTKHGWVCGVYKIRYASNWRWGTTHVKPESRKVLAAAKKKNEKLICERHYELITGKKHSEDRRLESAG
jgi:GT2 family glycosyltransferase